jgi:hypothetical protein
VAVVQYTFTHKQYTEYRERNIHNNKNKRKKLGSAGRPPSLKSYTLAFALQLRRRHEQASVRVVENFLDIPVAVVQYKLTRKQYTEQLNLYSIYIYCIETDRERDRERERDRLTQLVY